MLLGGLCLVIGIVLAAVIQALMAAQEQNGGWLTDELMAAVVARKAPWNSLTWPVIESRTR